MKKLLLSIGTVGTLVTIGVGAFPFLVSGQAEDWTANILFSQPLSLKEVLDVASDNALKPIFLEHDFTIPGRKKSVGFIPVSDGIAAADLEAKAKDAHRTFLLDMAVDKNNGESAVFTQAAEKTGDIKIARMTVQSNGKVLDTLKGKDARIQEVQIRKPESVRSRLQSFMRGIVETTIAAVDQETWVPEYGKVQTGDSSTEGERYVWQKLHWDDASGFAVSDTYEPDFFLYNYDGTNGKNYLDKRETSGSFPVMAYASSDLPSAYLDTRAMDPTNSLGERNELAYTIGSSNADTITTGYTYITYIRTAKGQASTDKGKLQSQRGYRSPSWCYTTWCSFGYENDSTSRYKPVTSWTVPVPGYLEWRK